MKNVIRFIAGIAFWLVFAALRLVLIIIGWVVVPFTDPETNPIWGNREHPKAPKTLDKKPYRYAKPSNRKLYGYPVVAFIATWLVFGWWLPYGEVLAGFVSGATFYNITEYGNTYIWRAWRNPTNNLRYWFEEPSKKEWDLLKGWYDPERTTRTGARNSVWRFIISGIFWEYWYQRAVGDEFFEFRIGWKFGSEVPGFGHTFQLRKGP